MWVDDTSMISDNLTKFFEIFPLKDLNFNEFLYSKGDIAYNILEQFSKIDKKHYLL